MSTDPSLNEDVLFCDLHLFATSLLWYESIIYQSRFVTLLRCNGAVVKHEHYQMHLFRKPPFCASNDSWCRCWRIHRYVAASVWGLGCYQVHRVHRVPGFLSGRPHWVPPTHSPASECCSLQGGRHTRLRERGWRGPNSGAEVRQSGTLVYNNPSTPGTNLVSNAFAVSKLLRFRKLSIVKIIWVIYHISCRL